MSDELKWIVRRLNWRLLLASDQGTRYVRFPGATIVAEFNTQQEAEADCWDRERVMRAMVNPFSCGVELADYTHIPDFAFKDYLLDDSIRPAKGDSYAQVRWDKWWDKHSPGWSDDRKARIWEALDKVRFFAVECRGEGAEVFVVVEGMPADEYIPWWSQGGRTFEHYGYEGGRLVQAFRSRENADALGELLAEKLPCDPSRMRRDVYPFSTSPHAGESPVDEVIAVPFAGSDSGRVFVVGRVGLRIEPHWPPAFWEFDRYPTGEHEWIEFTDWEGMVGRRQRRRLEPQLVPEAAFTDRESAEADAQARDAAARRWLNPFRLRPFAEAGMTEELTGLGPQITGPRHSNRTAQWWSAHIANAPDEEHDRAWGTLPQHPLYRVTEIEMED